MDNIQGIYDLADQVQIYKQKRGHYFALQKWNDLLTSWCDVNNIDRNDIPEHVIQDLKARDLIFCDYFV